MFLVWGLKKSVWTSLLRMFLPRKVGCIQTPLDVIVAICLDDRYEAYLLGNQVHQINLSTLKMILVMSIWPDFAFEGNNCILSQLSLALKYPLWFKMKKLPTRHPNMMVCDLTNWLSECKPKTPSSYYISLSKKATYFHQTWRENCSVVVGRLTDKSSPRLFLQVFLPSLCPSAALTRLLLSS